MQRNLVLAVIVGCLLLLGFAGSVALQGADPPPSVPVAAGVRAKPAVPLAPARDVGASRVTLERARRAVAQARQDAPAAVMGAGGDADTAPVPLVLDEMAEFEERAAAGDPEAACRVAAALSQCRYARNVHPVRQQRSLERAREDARTASPGNHRRQLADRRVQMLERQLRLSELCRGVDEELLALQPWLDLRAAKLGDVHAARRFVSGRGMGAAMLASDPSVGALYREHAWPLFQQMLQRGDQAAVWAWAHAVMARSDALLWSVMPAEWNRPEVVRGLIRRVQQGRRDDHDVPPDPEFEVLDPEADREAEALFQQYFAGTVRGDADEELPEGFKDPAELCAEPAGESLPP